VRACNEKAERHGAATTPVPVERDAEPDRGAAQTIDAALATRVGFDLEDFGQEDERLIAAGIEEPLGHLLGRAGQLELGETNSAKRSELPSRVTLDE